MKLTKRDVTYVLPGPQAVGHVLVVQNSDSALDSRFMCLKKATAGSNQKHKLVSARRKYFGEQKLKYLLLLASHSALSTPGGSAVRANMSESVIRWRTYGSCRYGRSS